MYKTTNMIIKNPIYLLSKNNATAVIMKDKLLKGLFLAYERMIALKRKNNQKIMIRQEGKIVTITP